MKIKLNDKIIINPQVISKDVEGKVYILDPRNGTIHTLNETASFIWRCLKTPHSIKQIAQKMGENFQIDEIKSLHDITTFIEKYLDQSLVVFQKKA